MLRRIVIAALLVLGLARSAGAQPHVTLKLENVTLLQALWAMQRECGWEFKMDDHALSELEDEAKDPRGSFDFQDQSVGAVCRALAEKFNLQPQMLGQRGVEFRSGFPKPAKPLYEMSSGGFSVAVSQVSRAADTTQDFGKATPILPNRYQGLTITVRPESGDPDLIDGILNLQIITDRGPADGFAREGWQRVAMAPGGPPDAWELKLTQVRFPPRATEILRISGDLAVFRHPRSEQLRIPLPASKLPLYRNIGAVKLDVTRLEVSPFGRLTFDSDGLWPSNELNFGARISEWPAPVVTTHSGRVYPITGDRNVILESGVRRLRFRGALTLPRLEDPAALVLWEIPTPEDSANRIFFRLRNIPIPSVPADAAK